jgi:hypothetical protein
MRTQSKAVFMVRNVFVGVIAGRKVEVKFSTHTSTFMALSGDHARVAGSGV